MPKYINARRTAGHAQSDLDTNRFQNIDRGRLERGNWSNSESVDDFEEQKLKIKN